MGTPPRRLILLLSILSTLALPTLSHALPATDPSSQPSLQITPTTSQLPQSPGWHVFSVKVSGANAPFPMAVGINLPPNFSPATQPLPMFVTLQNAYSKGKGGVSLTGEGLGHEMTTDTWDTRDTGQHPQNPVFPRLGNFIVLSPECPANQDFYTGAIPQAVDALISKIQQLYPVDPDRIYLTGWSYGGTSTWQLATLYPNRFAAVIPISAREPFNPDLTVNNLANVPLYIAVGENDTTFRPLIEDMDQRLTAANHQNLVFQEIKNGNHFSYNDVYTDPNFWTWLNAQHLPHPASSPAAPPPPPHRTRNHAPNPPPPASQPL